MTAFLRQHGAEIARLTFEHLWLTGFAMVLAIAIGLPVGILLTRYEAAARPVIAFANIVQVIPSLALFGLLLPVPFLGDNAARLAILALTGYALLPILRNTYAGIRSVDPALLDVANAMGMSGLQRLLKVELPLAASVILAGLRTATVTCVGVATIAAAIGAGGLGELIFRGVASVDNGLVLAGAIPAALLALAADGLLGLLEKKSRGAAMKTSEDLTSHLSRSCCDGGGTRVLMLVLGLLTACAPPRSSRIAIGAKNFTEQVVLGELLAQEIEAVSHQPVERRFYLAGSYLCQQALVSGRIDGYVEYTGTALTAILKQPLDRDAERVLATVSRLYEDKYKVRVEPPLGFEDTFAMVVRGADAQRLGVKTISDLKRIGPADSAAAKEPMSQKRDMRHPDSRLDWRLGVGYEFQSRPDGLVGLEKAYGLDFPTQRVMDLGLLYRALSLGQVDLVAGNSTDGPIRALGFAVLADDKHYFPPYQAVPLIREDSLRLHPEIQVAMDRLAGKVDAAEMQGMNDAVDGRHLDVGDVVRRFRAGKGL